MENVAQDGKKMTVGLIDVDSHHFPNLALMRISAYHKSHGDHVEWWMGDLFHYDLVYKSKVFSDAYSQDIPDPVNCDRVIKGGTGYCISLQGGWNGLTKAKTNRSLRRSSGCFRTIRSIRSINSR